MTVTVRFLFLLTILLQFGTKHLVVRHLQNYHGMLSVPANDPKKLSGRESGPDSYLFERVHYIEVLLYLK